MSNVKFFCLIKYKLSIKLLWIAKNHQASK